MAMSIKERATRKAASKKTSPHSRTAVIDWPLIERVLMCDAIRSTYLWGPPGIGKTYVAYHKGLNGRSLYAVTLTEETPASELRGMWIPKGDGLVWHEGPVARAMREGGRLVLNELSHAGEDVIAFLYPILENPETARLTLPTNETITPAPGFEVVSTDNVSPDELPEALQDRFETTLEIEEPHSEALALLDPMLREAAQRSFGLEKERRVSLRGWLVLQRLIPVFGLHDACLVVFGAERGSQIHDGLVMAGEGS